jgi:hypothetical protein
MYFNTHKEDKAMRFTYENKLYLILQDGSVSIVDNDSSTTFNEDKHLENLNNFSVSSYKELLKIIRNETKSLTEKAYLCFTNGNYFLLLTKEVTGEFTAKAFYEMESPEIKSLLKRLLVVDDNNGKLIVSNIHNNFTFIAPYHILKLMFVNAELKSNGEESFHKFKLKSKNGKIRDIIAPHKNIKEILKDLNVILQKVYDKKNADFQVAYKKGKNIKDNANIHINNQYVYNVDLKDFYPSCKRELVEKYVAFFFKNIPNKNVVIDEFMSIILDNNALFIGSPISGTLANVIISRPVKYIKNITKNFGMEFSVYADDMSFSSSRFISGEFVSNIFNLAFSKYGLDSYFKLNEKKSHGMSKNRRRITGVSVNSENQTTISRNFYRNLRVKIHKLSIGDTSINLQKLRGQLAFASMVDNSGKIFRILEKFYDVTAKFKLVSDEKYIELKEMATKNV